MDVETVLPEIGADDFARRFSLRAANLMWLLGAGASASAGIPTAGDMIWDFKQALYVSQKRTSPQAVADLTSPTIRSRLQAHIDSSGNLPIVDAPDEYAALFEAVYPAEADRRAYLDAKIGGAKPSYGHIALATLMRADLTRLVWTTNFDPLVADACAKVYDGTGYLTTSISTRQTSPGNASMTDGGRSKSSYTVTSGPGGLRIRPMNFASKTNACVKSWSNLRAASASLWLAIAVGIHQ